MADYSKVNISGGWTKAAELQEGQKATIVSECQPIESQFTNEDGSKKMQDVCKVRYEGKEDALNTNLNRATLQGLVAAFGTDSKQWIGKPLTVHTEKVAVAGRRVTALYLLPEGFEVGEDSKGYVQIVRSGSSAADIQFEAGIDEVMGGEPTI